MVASRKSSVDEKQSDIDARNREFWNELCGSQLAKQLGVTDSSPASLDKFDRWYMEFYPYLLRHVPLAEIKGKSVMEVGLGYGTLSQKLAEVAADYRGLDIAGGPVAMVNHRLAQHGLGGQAVQGSVLECPFPDAAFDWVVAIGCLHHTGNLQRALDEAWRVLKPGGRAMVMVYYAYSYRRWMYSPLASTRHLLSDKFRIGRPRISATERERAHYDASAENGGGAPETAFTSATDMQRMTAKWSRCEVHRENIGEEAIFRFMSREKAIASWGPWCGLDIYCSLTK